MMTRRVLLFLVTVALLAWSSRPASAQVDPLLSLKRMPPSVILVLDTSFRMLFDDQGDYYDVKTYTRSDDTSVATVLGVTSSQPQYRRVYKGLQYEVTQSSSSKYLASDIRVVPSTDPGYPTFWAPTRWETAKAGMAQAVLENQNLVRWGFLKLRQSGEGWRSANNDCDKPVRITNNPALTVGDTNPCHAGTAGRFVNGAPKSSGASYNQTSSPGDAIVHAVGTNNATNIRTLLTAAVGSGTLVPASQGSATFVDRPLYYALVDARAHAISTMNADTSVARACRNTVVVLVTSGKDDGSATYLGHTSITSYASTFASVSLSGGITRRVPIVVIGVKPDAADETQLQAIATNSGGAYFKATTPADVTAAVNYAVQLGFSNGVDVDANRRSEYSLVSPLVGTVNLEGAKSATGAALPNTSIVATRGAALGAALPQRSNFLLTTGFGLPGFDGRLRAFRAYAPLPDATRASGWKFAGDGTRLWPDLDGRASLAGMARTPASESDRNIYTYVPNPSGSGGEMVPFTVGNASALAPYLGGANAEALIRHVRSQPLGAFIGSTPAIMDPPSLDPPPDELYGYPDSVDTFAGTYKDRRSMIFFGANDGMIHAVDARTGYEVWAFVPFNLLPKLRTLLDGQPVEQFEYFVDSSPKVAEVKVDGAWRTMLVIGQGYGGTFYQAFDVTEAGMCGSPEADTLSAVQALLGCFNTPNESISFSWAFPRYSVFDTTVSYSNASLGNTFPGGRIVMYGDLKSSASAVEKRVGFTFSDPAVGALTVDRSITAVITASGYFPDIEAGLPGRGATAPEAGHAMFLLNAATGLPVGNPTGSACAGVGCLDVGNLNRASRKNAIQADLTASSDALSTRVSLAYAGDTDGRYWRFSFTSTGAITSTVMASTGQPIYSSSALLLVGTTEKYLFFSTGSDVLPSTAPGGGSGTGTTFSLFGVKDGPATGTVMFQFPLASKVLTATTAPLTNGERPTSAPIVAGDIVFFSTTTEGATFACSDASSKTYAFTYRGTAAYDGNRNGKYDTVDSLIATSTGRASAPFIVDQHLWIGSSALSGPGATVIGNTEDFNNGIGRVGVRILSWREIR